MELASGIPYPEDDVAVNRDAETQPTPLPQLLDCKALQTEHGVTRAAAEALIVESGIAATILRPTMIYGSRRDRNISRLIGYVKASPLIPVFGSGRHLQQPVHVDDVAAAIACSALTPLATGRTYTVAGPQALSYNQVIDAVAAAVGRRVLTIHLPASPVVAALSRLESVGIKLPIKSEQVRRLEEDKTFEIADAVRDLGFSPRSFQEGVRLEVAEMAGNA